MRHDFPPLSLKSGTYLYVDDTSIFYQAKDVHKIVLNKVFLTLCELLFDNRQSIHFGENKTKDALFSKTKRSSKLYIKSVIKW